jgi:DnaK suppressor protein
MNRSEIEYYGALLQAREAEHSTFLRDRNDIVIEKAADKLDEVQFAGERELAIRNLDRESKLLRSIRTALARLEDGSYGECLNCGARIGPKRLNAVPWAACCVGCQEAADRCDIEGAAPKARYELLEV